MVIPDAAAGALVTGATLGIGGTVKYFVTTLRSKKKEDASVTVRLADIVDHNSQRIMDRLATVEGRSDEQSLLIRTLSRSLDEARTKIDELAKVNDALVETNAKLARDNEALKQINAELRAENRTFEQKVISMQEQMADAGFCNIAKTCDLYVSPTDSEESEGEDKLS